MAAVISYRKADNGISTGNEFLIKHADGSEEWEDEHFIPPDVFDAFDDAEEGRNRKRRRDWLRHQVRVAKPPARSPPTHIADGPRRGDRIEVNFGTQHRPKWHAGYVESHPADEGDLVYTVRYDNKHTFKDALTLDWRLISHPEPSCIEDGPSQGQDVEVEWPTSRTGRGKRWFKGRVLRVTVPSDGGAPTYSIQYANGNNFTDRLLLPWRRAPQVACSPAKRHKTTGVAATPAAAGGELNVSEEALELNLNREPSSTSDDEGLPSDAEDGPVAQPREATPHAWEGAAMSDDEFDDDAFGSSATDEEAGAGQAEDALMSDDEDEFDDDAFGSSATGEEAGAGQAEDAPMSDDEDESDDDAFGSNVFTESYQGAQYWYEKMKRDHEERRANEKKTDTGAERTGEEAGGADLSALQRIQDAANDVAASLQQLISEQQA